MRSMSFVQVKAVISTTRCLMALWTVHVWGGGLRVWVGGNGHEHLGHLKFNSCAFQMIQLKHNKLRHEKTGQQKHITKKHRKPHVTCIFKLLFFLVGGVGHPKQWSIVEGGEIKPSKVRNFRVLLSQLWPKTSEHFWLWHLVGKKQLSSSLSHFGPWGLKSLNSLFPY